MRSDKKFRSIWRSRKTHGKVALALMFTMAVSVLGGCGNSVQGGDAGDGQDNSRLSEAMGRYVEEAIDLSEKLSGSGNELYQLSNGNLIVSDKTWDFLKTGDGINWLTDRRGWRTEMIENGTYIMSLAVGADNTVGVIYQEEAGEKQPEAEEKQPEAEKDAVAVTLNPKLLIIRPDNTQVSADVALTEEDAYINQVYIADNGRIFVSTRGSGNLYEVMEDGSSSLFLTLAEGTPDLIRFQGDLMVIDGYGYDGLVLYDMEKEEYIEDDALYEFVEENYTGRDSSNGNFYDLYFFFGEDEILYLAGKKGLYRHVIGGSAMEQVIDGELCSLGNPAYGLQGMAALADNEFLALFAGGKAIRYTYNPDIATIPGEKLKVYGLSDNETIRQAISLYQAKNPDVYIQFEFGMGGDDSVTREDALKKLNTEIMAGEGPDILLLDNMPVDSYIEKGLLLDLSPIINNLSGNAELFGNIVNAMKTSEQLYAVPCEVQLPVMLTDKKYLSGVNDLESIADMIEQLREDNPEQDLLGLCSEKSIMRLFSMTCVPAWMTESGEIDKDAIREFLKQTKRIYDAQMDGISERVIDNYQSMAEDYMLYNGVASFEDSDYVRMAGRNQMNYIGGYNRILFGSFKYIDITSVKKTSGFENTEWAPMKGQGGNVFWAETLLGINAASKHLESAGDFLKMCLGKENQSYLYQSLPVNKTAFEEKMVLPENEVDSSGMWGSVVTESYDGTRIVLVYYWPTEEEIADYTQYMETVDTAYYENDMLENAVYEEGIAYIQGTQSLEEAVGAIEQKVSLYMAE